MGSCDASHLASGKTFKAAGHPGTRREADSSHAWPRCGHTRVEMSHRLPISFCHEARENVCVCVLTIASSRIRPVCAPRQHHEPTPNPPREGTVTGTRRGQINGSRNYHRSCGRCRVEEIQGRHKSSDNWRALLLNGTVNHAPESVAFFFAPAGVRNRFGLDGGFSRKRMGR